MRHLADRVYILTEARQVPAIRQQLPNLSDGDFIVEPVARGTANAYGLAAFHVAREAPDTLMLCCPADHVVQGEVAFQEAVTKACEAAMQTAKLVTIGLRPTYPATGFGYIRVGGAEEAGALVVEEFVEKPTLRHAEEYLASGRYFWNLAMFTWRAADFLRELEAHAPEHHRGLAGGLDYADLPNEAVDYAVMERTKNLLLVPASFTWLDVGSWSELQELLPNDQQGNTIHGEAALIDTRGSFLSAPGKVVAALGVEDLIVIDTEQALLVLPKRRAQEVKRLVEMLKASGRTRYL